MFTSLISMNKNRLCKLHKSTKGVAVLFPGICFVVWYLQCYSLDIKFVNGNAAAGAANKSKLSTGEVNDVTVTFSISTGAVTMLSGKDSCPSQPLLTMVKGGRLGNLIGTYATLYSVAQKYSYYAVVPPDVLFELKKYFPYLTLPSSDTLPKHCTVTHDIRVPSGPAQLGVNLQIPRYDAELKKFHPYRDAVVKEFRFHPATLGKARNYLKRAKELHGAKTAVGVHVRRTDYVKYIQQRWNDTVVDQRFINAAMESVSGLDNTNADASTTQPVFVVLSDDVPWCKEHLNRTRFHMFFHEKREDPGVDMAILSLCDHVIISVGSFGFWGAYLSQKNVTYPDKNAPFYKHAELVGLKGWTKLSLKT